MSFLFNCCKRDNSNKGGNYQIDIKDGNKYITQYVDSVKDIKNWKQTQRVLRVNRSQYDQLIQQFSGNKKWTDPTFPPNSKSLGKLNHVPTDCQWKRISQIIDKPQMFVDKIQPQDVVQGSLGDCYFLSAVSALAQKQGTITKIFSNQQYNLNGIYKVTLRVDGIIQQILIDDFVPVNKSNKPIFCQPRNNEIWVLILEKAWAKANGSYANINSGMPTQVFKAVTYAPSQLKPIKNQPEYLDKLWQQILVQAKLNNPTCCGTGNHQNINWTDLGLVAGHAYTLVDAANVKDDSGRMHKMLKIRNPWGFNQWKGMGHEADHAFWARVPNGERVNFQTQRQIKNDGLFYMKYEDFCQFFNEIHFCYLLDKAIYEVEPMYSDQVHGSIFTINVTKQDNYILQLHQSSLKGQNDKRTKQGINRSTLLLAKGTNYQFLDGSLKYHETDNSLKVHLIPGKYFIYAKIDPSINLGLMPQSMSVSSYSATYADILPTQKNSHPDFFKKVFLSYARNNKRKQYNNGLMWISFKLLFEKGGFAYLAFGVDPRSDKKFMVTIDQADFNNLGYILKKPHKNQGKQTIQVKPGQQHIIIARVKNSPLQPMKFPPPMDIQIL